MNTKRVLLFGSLLLTLILFVGQAGLSADETNPPRTQPAPRAAQPPQPPNIPPGLDPAEVQKRLDEFRKRLEEQRKNKGGNPGVPGGWGGGIGGKGGAAWGGGKGRGKSSRTSPQRARLGAEMTRPTKVLIDQLDLPRSKGMVLENVEANSAAAKAGLKSSDILLEIDGKAVPSTPIALDKVLEGIKANKAVDVVVMRRGKKETVKGLTLPEAKAEAPPVRAPRRGGVVPPNPNPPGLPNLPPARGGFGNRTSVTRTNDQFTVTKTSNARTIVVKGKLDQGVVTVTEVTVTENGQTNTYASLDKVPAAHRATAKKLGDLGAGRNRGGNRGANP